MVIGVAIRGVALKPVLTAGKIERAVALGLVAFLLLGFCVLTGFSVGIFSCRQPSYRCLWRLSSALARQLCRARNNSLRLLPSRATPGCHVPALKSLRPAMPRAKIGPDRLER